MFGLILIKHSFVCLNKKDAPWKMAPIRPIFSPWTPIWALFIDFPFWARPVLGTSRRATLRATTLKMYLIHDPAWIFAFESTECHGSQDTLKVCKAFHALEMTHGTCMASSLKQRVTSHTDRDTPYYRLGTKTGWFRF